MAWKYYAPWAGTTDRDVECLLGAAMLCRTNQVRALGGFDESVPLYLDDMDLCKRLGQLGRLRYISRAPLLHHYSVGTRKLPYGLTKRLGLQATYQYLVNTVGALLVARAAARAGARSVYISTDFVFSGDKPPAEDGRLTPDTAWVEDDPARPLNVYGASKAAGEEAVRLADPRHLIAR